MRLFGKVAFVTGAHRGIGRAIAIRMAEEGANIITADIGRNMSSVPAPLSSDEDARETSRAVEALGRKVVTGVADVRSQKELKDVVEAGVSELGGLDIVVANAGIFPVKHEGADEELAFDDAIGVNLKGVWNTIKVTREHLARRGSGASLTIVNSTAGLRGLSDGWGGYDGYVAAKHGAVGLMKSYANILAPDNIRVNSVHPSNVNTSIVNNAVNATKRENKSDYPKNLLPIERLEPNDIANAIVWLASDEARYVTGVALPVDAGFSARR